MTRTADPYDTFARVYDAWQAGFSKPFSEAILPFYEREILARGAPEHSLADLACGTGTFLDAWRKRHPEWRLVGTDQSTAMLAVARRRLGGPGGGVSLFAQPLQKTALSPPVGAIVSVFDSVNHLLKPADLARALRAAYRSLLPGGLLLFDVTDERTFPSFFQGTWTVETDDLHVTATATCTEDRRSGQIRFTVFERRGRGWRRSDFNVRERNWPAQELRAALGASGFSVLRMRRVQPYPPEEADPPRPLWIARR
jgi:SAM-dependent methyltransferase